MNQDFWRTIESYIDFAERMFRQKELIAAFAVFGTLLAVGIAFVIPPTYRSSTIVRIEQQRLPTEYVRSTVSVDLGRRVATLSPATMSWNQLADLAKKFNLYGYTRNAEELEWTVDEMRKAMTVQVKGEDVFRISFDYRYPEISQQVTQELARLFIQTTLNDRVRQATQISSFLDAEVKDLSRRLVAQEAVLRAAGIQHPVLMTSGLSSKTETDGDGSLGAPSNAELGFLMAQLAEKRAQYTDHHPDVRRLKNKIAQVTANLAKHPVSGEQSRPFLAVGNRTLLVREYVNTRDHYEALLNKKFEAALAMNLERQQVESAYKIIDQAFYPLVPVRPRRALIVIVGFFLSLGAGIATVFVRDMMASNATAIIYRNITQIRGPDRRRNAGLVAAHEQAPKELTG